MIEHSKPRTELPVIPLSDPAVWQDLPGMLGTVRERSAIGMTDSGVPMILRYEGVRSALKDPRVSQNDLSFLGHPAEGFVNRWYRKSMAAMDPPDHTRVRGLVARAFTNRRMEEMRPTVRAIAEQTMMPLIEEGKFDALGRFSQELPIKAVMAIFDIPDEELDLFFELAHEFGLLFSFTAAGNPQTEARLKRAMSGLDAYVADLIERRRRHPGDDLLSQLASVAEGEDRLTEEELIIMVGTFLYAGVETTEAMLPIMITLFARHPEQFDRVRLDPKLIPNAVEEALRFEPNVGVIARVVKQPFELSGVDLRGGELILNSIVAANRDPRRWTRPDEFLIDREKPKTLGFGAGIHHCIGAALAYTEMEEALRVLLRARRLELLNDPAWEPFSNTRQFDRVSVATRM